MNDKVIYISLDDWRVIYFKGKLFAEGHQIPSEKLIRLGMIMKEANIDISDMVRLFIEFDDVSDESILWDWSPNIEDLNDEVKTLINKHR